MGIMILAAGVASVYMILVLYYLWYWRMTQVMDVPKNFVPATGFSVVIVAHNEENSIERCLRGVLNQHYPESLFEILVINDRSADRTPEIVQQMNSSGVRLLHLSDFPEFIHPPAYKKSAIELGVSLAHHDWIVVTDADCFSPVEWLRNIAYPLSNTDAVFLASPIQYSAGNSMLEKMQVMEMAVLMLITAAGIRSGLHVMANGANMAFSKQAFLDVGGYQGNFQYASGDDMFLIEKMKIYAPDKISFIESKDAIVETAAKPDWNSLLKQRIRWAVKNKGLRSPAISIIWAFVGFYHLMILITFVTALFHFTDWWSFFILIVIKWIADIIIIQSAALFFTNKINLINIIPLQLMYSVYVIRLGWNLIVVRKGDW